MSMRENEQHHNEEITKAKPHTFTNDIKRLKESFNTKPKIHHTFSTLAYPMNPLFMDDWNIQPWSPYIPYEIEVENQVSRKIRDINC